MFIHFGRDNIIKNNYEELKIAHGSYHDNVQYDWKDEKYIDVVKTKNAATGSYGIYGAVRIGERYKITKEVSKACLRVFRSCIKQYLT